MPGVYEFAPKRMLRRLLTISMLIGLVGTASFVRAASQVKDTQSIGLAAIAVLATAMVWAIRAGASVTTLEVHQGQLQVVQQGGRFIFDLSSKYTRFEVHSSPATAAGTSCSRAAACRRSRSTSPWSTPTTSCGCCGSPVRSS